MKKLLFFFIALIGITILTGCGKKEILCEGEMNQSDITAKIKVTGNFENDKLVKQLNELEFDLTNYLEYANLDTYYETFKTEYIKYNDYDGISTDVKKGENSVIVSMEIDLKKVDEDSYKKLNFGSGSLEVSSKIFKKEYLDMGLTCK